MKPTVLGIVIVLALIAAGAIFYAGSAFAPAPAPAPEQLYSNGVYGMSFSYPAGYLLSEEATDDGYRITLIKSEDAVPVVGGGEGPVAITLDIREIPVGLDLEGWIRGIPESNFALGPGELSKETVGGTDALRYSWSGLYEGESVALIHQGRVFLFSVTHTSPADQIRIDFEALLLSLRLR